MIGFTYYRFLLRNAVLKKSSWFLAILMLVFNAVFLILIPSLMHTTVFYVWGNAFLNPQMFEIYIGALLSATFAISIFSEYIENGTELIIMSKPLTRLQITLCKFLVLVTTVIFYTLFNSSVVLLVYYFTDCTTYECLNLLCSLLMSTFTFLLLFGSFAVLCSMYVGKVWVFIINFSLALIMMIYSISIRFSVYTPSQVLLSDKKHLIQTNRAINKDGKEVDFANIAKIPDVNTAQQLFNYVGFGAVGGLYDGLQKVVNGQIFPQDFKDKYYDKYTPMIGDYFQYDDINNTWYIKPDVPNSSLLDFDACVKQWAESTKKSKIGISNTFNLSQQFMHMNNMFSLQDNMAKQSSYPFGNDSFFQYKIDSALTEEQQADLISYNIETYIPNYGSLVSNAEFTGISLLLSGCGGSTILCCSFFQYLTSMLISSTDELAGVSSTDADPTATLLTGLTKNGSNTSLNIGYINSQSNKSSTNGYTDYTIDELEVNENEKQLFLNICNELVNAKQDDYGAYDEYWFPHTSTDTVYPQLNFERKDDVLLTKLKKEPYNCKNPYDVFHYRAIMGYDQTDTDYPLATGVVSINDDTTLTKEFLKFKKFLICDLPNIKFQTDDASSITKKSLIDICNEAKHPKQNGVLSPSFVRYANNENNGIYNSFLETSYKDPNDQTDSEQLVSERMTTYINNLLNNAVTPSLFQTLNREPIDPTSGKDKFDAIFKVWDETTGSYKEPTWNDLCNSNGWGGVLPFSFAQSNTSVVNSQLLGSFSLNQNNSINRQLNRSGVQNYKYANKNPWASALACINYFTMLPNKIGYERLKTYDNIEDYAKDYNRAQINIANVHTFSVSTFFQLERTGFNYKVYTNTPFFLIAIYWLTISCTLCIGVAVLYYKKDIR